MASMKLFYKPLHALIQATGSRWLTGSFFCAGGSALCIVLQAWALSRCVSEVFPVSSQGNKVLFYILIFIIASGCRVVLAYAEQWLLSRLSVAVRDQVRRRLAVHVTQIGPAGLRTEDPAAWTVAFIDQTESLDSYIRFYLPQWAHAAIVPVIIGLTAFFADWFSALVLLITAPLIPLFMILIGHQTERLTQQRWESLSFLGSYFFDRIQGMQTLQWLNQAIPQRQKVRDASEKFACRTMEVLKVAFVSALALELTASLSIAIIAVETGLRLMHGYMDYMPALFVLLLAPEFYQPLRLLGARFHGGIEGITAMKAIENKITPPVIQNSIPVSGENIPDLPLEIVLKNVTFQYPSADKPALNQLHCRFSAGQRNAIIGPNGSGKSTLSYLLMRWLIPQEGQILINQLDLHQISEAVWRKTIAWIPQHPQMYAGTVMENILIGYPQATAEALEEAIEKAGLTAWLQKQPLGLRTKVAERGFNLSQGQIQRIAVARAFVKKASLLIFDEPTNYLDPDLEEQLSSWIQPANSEQTVIVIAHRLTTIRKAAHVVFLDQGTCKAEGSHQWLYQNSPEYRQWVQTSGRKEHAEN